MNFWNWDVVLRNIKMWNIFVITTKFSSNDSRINTEYFSHVHRLIITCVISCRKLYLLVQWLCKIYAASSDGNRSHFRGRWSVYQHWPMIDHQWQLLHFCVNVFVDYNYSNSLISWVCLTKVKRRIKLNRIRTCVQTTIFFLLLWSLVILKYIDRKKS